MKQKMMTPRTTNLYDKITTYNRQQQSAASNISLVNEENKPGS